MSRPELAVGAALARAADALSFTLEQLAVASTVEGGSREPPRAWRSIATRLNAAPPAEGLLELLEEVANRSHDVLGLALVQLAGDDADEEPGDTSRAVLRAWFCARVGRATGYLRDAVRQAEAGKLRASERLATLSALELVPPPARAEAHAPELLAERVVAGLELLETPGEEADRVLRAGVADRSGLAATAALRARRLDLVLRALRGEEPAPAAPRCVGNAAEVGACCSLAGVYNGFGSDAPTTFSCPKGCGCHD